MYYGYGMGGFFWDPTYILVIIGVVICLIASARVKSTYAKFEKVRSHSGVAAALTYVAAAASTILQLLRLVLLFGRRDD